MRYFGLRIRWKAHKARNVIVCRRTIRVIIKLPAVLMASNMYAPANSVILRIVGVVRDGDLKSVTICSAVYFLPT